MSINQFPRPEVFASDIFARKFDCKISFLDLPPILKYLILSVLYCVKFQREGFPNQPWHWHFLLCMHVHNRRKLRKWSDKMKINLSVSQLRLHVKAFEVHRLPLSGLKHFHARMIQTHTNIDKVFIPVLINLQPTHNRGRSKKIPIVCFFYPHSHANLISFYY